MIINLQLVIKQHNLFSIVKESNVARVVPSLFVYFMSLSRSHLHLCRYIIITLLKTRIIHLWTRHLIISLK